MSKNLKEKSQMGDLGPSDSNFGGERKESQFNNDNGPENQKKVQVIHECKRAIWSKIEELQKHTKETLDNRRNYLIKEMDQMLGEHFQHLREENQKKTQDVQDPYEQEKELNDALQQMTAIAQALDEKNRKLVLKNQQLDIDFKSQEDDRKILL